MIIFYHRASCRALGYVLSWIANRDQHQKASQDRPRQTRYWAFVKLLQRHRGVGFSPFQRDYNRESISSAGVHYSHFRMI